MNAEQEKSVIAYMASTWRVEFTEAQIAVWRETLEDRLPAHARDALRALKETTDIVPSHAEFVRAYDLAKQRADAQHEEQMLGKTGGAKCDCDGGWVEGPPNAAGYSNTVSPCPRCRPARKPAAEHEPRCTCAQCRYGPREYAEMRRGAPQSFIDAVNKKAGVVLDLGDF